MSFGFGISDFVCCGQLAYQLYIELKDAAGECQAFAKELLLLHQVILKIEALIIRAGNVLDDAEQATLGLCVDMCKDILFVQLAGVSSTFVDSDRGHGGRPTLSTGGELKPQLVISQMDYDDNSWPPKLTHLIYRVRQRFRERSFAGRIPKLRSAITTVTEKLTSFQVLGIQSLQIDNRDILNELHKLQIQAAQHLRDNYIHVESASERLEQGQASIESATKRLEQGQASVETAAQRLEQSQARIEAQIRALLESQQRDHSRPNSYSLDASSPEGRLTWMDLGRRLRAEGITPAMIEQNRELLVRAMKSSLEEGVSPAQSYRTAPQSFEDDYDRMDNAQPQQSIAKSLTSASTSLLGSAPVLGATFSRAFLERHNGAARSLDKEQNVQEGMKSLLKGMATEEQAEIGKYEEGEAIDMHDM